MFGLKSASRQLSFETFSVSTNLTNSVVFLLYMIEIYTEMVLLFEWQVICLMIIFAILAVLPNAVRRAGRGDDIM